MLIFLSKSNNCSKKSNGVCDTDAGHSFEISKNVTQKEYYMNDRGVLIKLDSDWQTGRFLKAVCTLNLCLWWMNYSTIPNALNIQRTLNSHHPSMLIPIKLSFNACPFKIGVF